MKKKLDNDEINFHLIFFDIWKNKIKLFLIVLITVIIIVGFHLVKKPQFNALTIIRPTNLYFLDQFNNYNDLINKTIILNKKEFNPKTYGFIEINKNNLLDLFLDKFDDTKFIIDIIKKHDLLKREDYANEQEYVDALERFALSIDLIEKSKNNKINWYISVDVSSKIIWEKILINLNLEINNYINKFLNENFIKSYDYAYQKRKFDIEDLEYSINNVKKNYEATTINRLAFLEEQASIARQLDIPKNTLGIQNFASPPNVISNVEIKNPYYMKGYVMIEKEINLIKSRTNKDAFMKNLLFLEQAKENLINDKSLKRIEFVFSKTPIKRSLTSENFRSATIISKKTKFKNLNPPLLAVIILSAILGFIISIIYLAINKNLKKRK